MREWDFILQRIGKVIQAISLLKIASVNLKVSTG
jgi:hypothetical protein